VQALRVIGVDVGGTKTLAAIVTGEGSIEERLERPTAVSSQDALLAQLDSQVAELRSREQDVSAIGFGLPSQIDQPSGRVLSSVNIPLADFDFRARMAEVQALPVGIDNDANAAAIGEWRAGAARGARHVVMLTLGTGIGGGLILDGQPYRGATGRGAELGHVVIEYDGPPCRCGGRGHLEAVAAGPAADRAARKLYGTGADAHELVGRGQAGEPEAVEALAAIGRRLGAGIASFMNVFEPEIVIVGGGFSAAGELLLAPAREIVAREALPSLRNQAPIVLAELGPDAGVIGAAMVAFEALARQG
jgi:glucokinase